MELSWTSRIKLTLIMGMGAAVLGWFLWDWFRPADGMGAVVLNLDAGKIAVLAGVCFVLGFVGYFIGWPLGRQKGVLAVPAGLCAVGLRGGTVFDLMLHTNTAGERITIYRTLCWEGFVWVGFVAMGYFGVLAAEKLRKSEAVALDGGPKRAKLADGAIALVAAVLGGMFFVKMFVKDVSFADEQVKMVVGQAANMQVCVGVMFAMGVTAFLIKYALDASWIWSGAATAIITVVSMAFVNVDNAKYMAANWPAIFYSSALLGVLPVQMVGWGVLGSIVGYWLAVRLRYWKQTQA